MGLFTNIFIEYHTVLLAGVGLLVHELVVYSSWVNISMFQHQEFEASTPKKSQANPYRWISNLRQILGSLQWPGFRVVSVLFPTKTVSCMSLWDLKRPRSEWIDTLHSTYPNTWKIDGFGTWSTFISRLFLARLPQILDANSLWGATLHEPVGGPLSKGAFQTSFRDHLQETIDFPMKKYGVFR